jgi:hypothetical protein
MMEAVRTSETSVDNHSTRQYNPEDSSEHHTRRRENLKSHKSSRYLIPELSHKTSIVLSCSANEWTWWCYEAVTVLANPVCRSNVVTGEHTVTPKGGHAICDGGAADKFCEWV